MGAPIIVWEQKPQDFDNQRWTWQGEGKDRRLQVKSSGFVLDVDDDKLVQQKTNEKSKSQLWRVVEVNE